MGIFKKKIDDKKASEQIERNRAKAEEIFYDDKKYGLFIKALDMKFKHFRHIRESIGMVPTLRDMINSYRTKKYTKLPFKTIAAILGALIYFVSPLDIIPDFIPFLGAIDDVAVISFCLKMIKDDLNAYLLWKEDEGR